MEKISITAENAGQRIDKFLAREFFLYSRANIAKKIKNGDVPVNDTSVKPSHILEEGDMVMLENFSREAEDKSLVINKEIKLDIIFENDDLIVINKQAGLQVHPSHGERKNTLVNALLFKYPEIIAVHDESIGAELRPGIVHRLDRDTSGVIVVARNVASFMALKENFKNRKTEKTYLAVAEGIFSDKEGIIEKPLAKSSDYSKQVIARKNTKTTVREAETHYKVLKEFKGYSLVEVRPKTGRTHQIRIHLASVGHPIVGDLIYNETRSAEIRDNVVKRQLLHASELSFSLFGSSFDFKATLPQDFEYFLAKVK